MVQMRDILHESERILFSLYVQSDDDVLKKTRPTSFVSPLASRVALLRFVMASAAAEKLARLNVAGGDDDWAADAPNLKKNLGILTPEEVSYPFIYLFKLHDSSI